MNVYVSIYVVNVTIKDLRGTINNVSSLNIQERENKSNSRWKEEDTLMEPFEFKITVGFL